MITTALQEKLTAYNEEVRNLVNTYEIQELIDYFEQLPDSVAGITNLKIFFDDLDYVLKKVNVMYNILIGFIKGYETATGTTLHIQKNLLVDHSIPHISKRTLKELGFYMPYDNIPLYPDGLFAEIIIKEN